MGAFEWVLAEGARLFVVRHALLLWLEFFQFAQKFFDVGQLVEGIDPGEGDLAVAVDDEGGALADAGDGRSFAEDAEGLGDRAVRVEVGAERDLGRANFFFLPRDVAGNGIDADVQDLGIECGELLTGSVERRHLGGSSGRPVEGMERDDDGLLAEEVTEPDTKLAFPRYRRQIEIGSGLSCF